MRTNGDTAIIHKSRGRASNRKYSDEFRGAVIKAVREKYNDFCPTLASEKLLQGQTLKNELIYQKIYATREEAIREIIEYIIIYN